MGLAFKENWPDLRNTRIVDIVRELGEYNIEVDVYDPWVSADEAEREYGIRPIAAHGSKDYDEIVLAVAHEQFAAMGPQAMHNMGKAEHVLYDLKNLLDAGAAGVRM